MQLNDLKKIAPFVGSSKLLAIYGMVSIQSDGKHCEVRSMAPWGCSSIKFECDEVVEGFSINFDHLVTLMKSGIKEVNFSLTKKEIQKEMRTVSVTMTHSLGEMVVPAHRYETMDQVSIKGYPDEKISVLSAQLKEAIKGAIPFLGSEDTYPDKPFFTRVVLKSGQGSLYVYGITMNQVFIHKIKDCLGDVCTTIPSDPSRALSSGLSDMDTEVSIESSGSVVCMKWESNECQYQTAFKTDSRDTIGRITNFANSLYKHDKVFTTDRGTLAQVVTLSQAMADKDIANYCVISGAGEGKISVSSSSKMNQYKSDTVVTVAGTHDWGKDITVSNDMLSKALSALSFFGEVDLKTSGHDKPMVITPCDDELTIAIITMPVAI